MATGKSGSKSRRVTGAAVIGAMAASALALGLAVPQSASAETVTTITGVNPNGNMKAATDDAADKCLAGGGAPGKYVKGHFNGDGTAIATIECIYP